MRPVCCAPAPCCCCFDRPALLPGGAAAGMARRADEPPARWPLHASVRSVCHHHPWSCCSHCCSAVLQLANGVRGAAASPGTAKPRPQVGRPAAGCLFCSRAECMIPAPGGPMLCMPGVPLLALHGPCKGLGHCPPAAARSCLAAWSHPSPLLPLPCTNFAAARIFRVFHPHPGDPRPLGGLRRGAAGLASFAGSTSSMQPEAVHGSRPAVHERQRICCCCGAGRRSSPRPRLQCSGWLGKPSSASSSPSNPVGGVFGPPPHPHPPGCSRWPQVISPLPACRSWRDCLGGWWQRWRRERSWRRPRRRCVLPTTGKPGAGRAAAWRGGLWWATLARCSGRRRPALHARGARAARFLAGSPAVAGLYTQHLLACLARRYPHPPFPTPRSLPHSTPRPPAPALPPPTHPPTQNAGTTLCRWHVAPPSVATSPCWVPSWPWGRLCAQRCHR